MADKSENKDEETPEQRQLIALISRVISHVANEPLLLVSYEHKQVDKFAGLWDESSQNN